MRYRMSEYILPPQQIARRKWPIQARVSVDIIIITTNCLTWKKAFWADFFRQKIWEERWAICEARGVRTSSSCCVWDHCLAPQGPGDPSMVKRLLADAGNQVLTTYCINMWWVTPNPPSKIPSRPGGWNNMLCTLEDAWPIADGYIIDMQNMQDATPISPATTACWPLSQITNSSMSSRAIIALVHHHNINNIFSNKWSVYYRTFRCCCCCTYVVQSKPTTSVYL